MSTDKPLWYGIYQPILTVNKNLKSQVQDYELLLRDENNNFPGKEFLDAILTQEGNERWIESVRPSVKAALTDHPERHIYLNLDPAQLTFPNVWEFLKETHKLYGDQVAIEITERRKLLPSINYFTEEFHKLKKLGYEIAIDDVSSGGNSYEFVYHHLEDIDRIKLSMLIFKNSTIKTALSFAEAWMDFAQEKEITFVLEGIDNKEVAQKFAGLPNVLQQGFYWQKGVKLA